MLVSQVFLKNRVYGKYLDTFDFCNGDGCPSGLSSSLPLPYASKPSMSYYLHEIASKKLA
jgi:hypothetical protein